MVLVLASTAVTSAPTTTPPEESVTTPEIAPRVVVWPQATREPRKNKSRKLTQSALALPAFPNADPDKKFSCSHFILMTTPPLRNSLLPGAQNDGGSCDGRVRKKERKAQIVRKRFLVTVQRLALPQVPLLPPETFARIFKQTFSRIV